MNNQKGIAPIIVILVLVASICGGYFSWQYFGDSKEVEDETADWNVFKNETFGYEIKYPEELSISDLSDDTGVFFVKKPEMNIMDFHIFVGVEPKKYTSIENYLNSFEEKFQEEINSGEVRILKEKVDIGGQKRDKLTILNLTNNSTLDIVLILFKEGNIILASQLYPKECELLECEIFKQMLSTFRFLE